MRHRRLVWYVFPDDLRCNAAEWDRAMQKFNGWFNFYSRKKAEAFCQKMEREFDIRCFYTNNQKRRQGLRRKKGMKVWISE